MINENLYDTLGVKENASQEEIKQAFRDKAKEHHPDKGGDKDKMVAISKAYSVLGDEGKRKRYDETGESEDVGFEQRFAGLVQGIFMALVEREEDVDGADLIGAFGDVIDGIIGENRKSLAGARRKVVKLERVVKRLGVKSGEDLIGAVMKNNLRNAKNEVKLAEQDIEFFVKAKEAVLRHEYHFDVPGAEEELGQRFKWISKA